MSPGNTNFNFNEQSLQNPSLNLTNLLMVVKFEAFMNEPLSPSEETTLGELSTDVKKASTQISSRLSTDGALTVPTYIKNQLAILEPLMDPGTSNDNLIDQLNSAPWMPKA